MRKFIVDDWFLCLLFVAIILVLLVCSDIMFFGYSTIWNDIVEFWE